MHGDPKFYDCNPCVSNAYIPFSIQMHNYTLMSSQDNVKDRDLEKKWRPLIFMFYLDFLSLDDSVCKKLEKLKHKFNYTHTY